MSDVYSSVEASPYTPDIQRMADEAEANYRAYPSPAKIAETEKKVSTIKGQEMAETEPARNRQISAARGDTANINSKYGAINPVNVQPWRPEDHPISNPLEAFGSYAGVFAMIASAATRQPIENTLNAGAAAINSVRNSDLAGLERAHTAWKENADLAFKTHKAQREDYDDAITKLKAGQAGSEAELSAVSAKYGDKIVKAYLDAGMSDKAISLLEKRNSAMDKLISIQPSLIKAGQEQYFQVMFQNQVNKTNAEHKQNNEPLMTPQELVRLRGEMQQQFAGSGADIDRVRLRELQDRGIKEENTRREEAGEPLMTAQEEARERGNIARLAQQNLGAPSGHKDDALAIRDMANDIFNKAKAEGTPITYADAQAEAKRRFSMQSGVITPNERNKIQVHIGQLDEAQKVIERVEGTIEKYVGAAGLAARPMRVKERLGNILGSNQTDRVQMMRDIEYLRLNAPRLLTESPARPMAADIQRINTIVAGLEMGDTGANTLRALEEIKKIYGRSRQSAMQRLSGTWRPEGDNPTAEPGAPASSPPAQNRNAPWANDPVIK